MEPFLCTKELAALFNVSQASIVTLYHAGRLPGLRLGPRMLRFRVSDVMEQLHQRPQGDLTMRMTGKQLARKQ